MYVLYYVFKDGSGEVSYGDEPAYFIDKPSECNWIVPGTIDPKDD